jgi:hypothetical protein
MAAEPASLELILYQLQEMQKGLNDIRVELKDHHGTFDKRLEGQAIRIRILEDEALKFKTILLPISTAISTAIGVGVKMLIDALGK